MVRSTNRKWNVYHNLFIREKTLHNGKLKQDFLDDIFFISSYSIIIGNSLIPEVLHTLVFLDSTYFCFLSLFFLFIFSFSFSFLPFSFYRHVSCSYLYSYPVANCTIRDIFLYFIGFLPCLILELWLLRVLVLFKLSYMHLMQQKLGENPLINAEEKFSIFLCVLEVSRDYRHLLKATCGLPVHHASSRLASYLFHENWFPVSLFSSLILGMI